MLGPTTLLNLDLSIGHSLMVVKKVLEHLVRDPFSEITEDPFMPKPNCHSCH